jgi:hypothetical protein
MKDSFLAVARFIFICGCLFGGMALAIILAQIIIRLLVEDPMMLLVIFICLFLVSCLILGYDFYKIRKNRV